MKKCPFCAEEIQDDAIKCRYCGEFLGKKEKWYFKTYVLIIGFLCVGPFILPLAWINPCFSRRKKIFMTIIIVVLSYYLGILFVNSIKSLKSYYELLQQFK